MYGKDEIQSELESLGSMLASLPRTNVYLIPEGYFNKFPETLMTFMSSGKGSWEHGNKKPFAVPEGYFDSMPEALLQRVKSERKKQGKVISLSPVLRRYLAGAAAVLLLLAGGGGLYRHYGHNSLEQQIAKLPEAAVSEYVLQTSSDLNQVVATNTASLPDYLTEEEISQFLDETGWQ